MSNLNEAYSKTTLPLDKSITTGGVPSKFESFDMKSVTGPSVAPSVAPSMKGGKKNKSKKGGKHSKSKNNKSRHNKSKKGGKHQKNKQKK